MPTKIMNDFELAIINACTGLFPGVPLSGYYFHLGQIIYRRVQGDGLQEWYQDPLDRTVKNCTHILLALAFVPEADALTSFTELHRECLAELYDVYDEFNEFFVTGKPARGRHPVTRPRYPISLWNQYETAINKLHRVNNISEGWHSRFQFEVKTAPTKKWNELQ